MPSPDMLPPGRSLSTEAAPPLDDVLSAARRRRRTHAGIAGAVVVAAFATTGAVVVSSLPSADTLKSVTPAVTSSPTDSPSVGPVTASPTPQESASSPQATTSPTAVGTDNPTATPSPSEPPTPMVIDSGPVTQVATGAVGPPRRTTHYDASRPCAGTGPTTAQGWCSYYTGPTSGSPGQSLALSAAICRLPGQSTGTLVSDNGEQADFTVEVHTYPPSWDWARGKTFSKTSTSIDVAPGTCVEWYVSWNVSDNNGQPLAPGTYDLDADPTMYPAGDTQADVQNVVQFTVN